MIWLIYHPEDGSMNHDCDESVVYKCIGGIVAANMAEAFREAQNDFNPDYRKHGVRSTSVGDVIVGNVPLMVTGTGYRDVPLFKRKTLDNVHNH